MMKNTVNMVLIRIIKIIWSKIGLVNIKLVCVSPEYILGIK
jgi:hypothetical protein